MELNGIAHLALDGFPSPTSSNTARKIRRICRIAGAGFFDDDEITAHHEHNAPAIDRRRRIKPVEAWPRSELRWLGWNWATAPVILGRATSARGRPFPNALCIDNLRSNDRYR